MRTRSQKRKAVEADAAAAAAVPLSERLGLSVVRTTPEEMEALGRSYDEKVVPSELDLKLSMCTMSSFVSYRPPLPTVTAATNPNTVSVSVVSATPIVYRINIHSVLQFISQLDVLVEDVMRDGFMAATLHTLDWSCCERRNECPDGVTPIDLHARHTFIDPEIETNRAHFPDTSLMRIHLSNFDGKPWFGFARDRRYFSDNVTFNALAPLIFFEGLLRGYRLVEPDSESDSDSRDAIVTVVAPNKRRKQHARRTTPEATPTLATTAAAANTAVSESSAPPVLSAPTTTTTTTTTTAIAAAPAVLTPST